MSYTDSAPATVTLSLQGVWLHDPDDPEGTAHNLPFGKAARAGSLEVEEQENVYAGREYAVVDFGEHTAERVDVRADVPFGSTWAADLAAVKAFVRARRTLVFRDNRGRVLTPAKMSALRESDTDTGTQVSFTVSRMDG